MQQRTAVSNMEGGINSECALGDGDSKDRQRCSRVVGLVDGCPKKNCYVMTSQTAAWRAALVCCNVTLETCQRQK